jgi:hypothetical protein
LAGDFETLKFINMEQLKLEELREGNLYHCPLSNKTVLVTQVNDMKDQIMGKVYEWKDVTCVYWDGNKYETFRAWDYQLTHLFSQPEKIE